MTVENGDKTLYINLAFHFCCENRDQIVSHPNLGQNDSTMILFESGKCLPKMSGESGISLTFEQLSPTSINKLWDTAKERLKPNAIE